MFVCFEGVCTRGCRIHRLSWIDVGSTSIAGCLRFSRAKMVFWAGFGIFGMVYRMFLSHFSHSSLSQLLCSIFYPFLNMFSLRCHQQNRLAQLWAAADLFWSCLEWALSWRYPGVFSQRPPLATRTLLHYPVCLSKQFFWYY